MSEFENSIFFDTLQQFASHAGGGQAISEAVASVASAGFREQATAEKTAQQNLRWFSCQPEKVRAQVVALAGAVRHYYAHHGERSSMSERPALTRLEHFEVAVAIYRKFRQEKKSVAAFVANTEFSNAAAHKAVVRINYFIIKQMRENKLSKPWPKISDALFTITGKRVPPGSLSKFYDEVTKEQERFDESLPKVATHYEGERHDAERDEAYRQLGWSIEQEGSA